MNHVNRTTRQLSNRAALAVLAAYALTTIHRYFIALFTYRLIRDRQQSDRPPSAQERATLAR